MLIDTHCHLTDERLAGEAEEIIASFDRDGLECAVTVGYDYQSSFGGKQIADTHEKVYCTLGIHPHDAKTATQAIYDEFITAATDPKVVAIGEIGLDYYYCLLYTSPSPRDTR